MRVLAAIAILALSVTAAGAADFHGARGGHFVAQYDPIGRPAGQLFVYDWEPGVAVRAYWLRPWRDHHYFPYGRDRADIRRMGPHPARPHPAEPFYRYWGTSSGFDVPPRYWPAPASHRDPPIIDK
jgi:hypothetical protein